MIHIPGLSPFYMHTLPRKRSCDTAAVDEAVRQNSSDKYSYERLLYPVPKQLENSAQIRVEQDIANGRSLWCVYKSCKHMNTHSFIISTPIFTDVRWLKETRDYSDGGLLSILFMGTLRSKEEKPILVGDWNDQSFDITSLSQSDDLIQITKMMGKSESFYNIENATPIAKGLLSIGISLSEQKKQKFKNKIQ